MEFRILGPLYADAGEGPATIAQPLLQSALAVLLLRANRTCSRSFLIDALWGSEPPQAPEAALRVCVSRLRHSLGDCAPRLVTVGPPGGRAPLHRQRRGYLMLVRPGELDVDEFTDLAAQGQAELDTGNAAAASAAFVQALALWGDPPLPDLPVTPVLASAVARLTSQRQAAADALVDARLAAGEYDQILTQLRAAVTADPGRERTCEQLMRACHGLGLRKEALEVYQLARKTALEQQGTEPGPALSVFYRRILAEETAVVDGDNRRTRPAQLPPHLPGSQTPAPPADFIGRSSEIAEIIKRLNGPGVPIVVVTGGPGMGKSAVAAATAYQLRDHFSDGQIYAEMGGLEDPRDPQDVLKDLLQTMGILGPKMPAPGPARAALFRSVLAGKKILIVADDAATARQIRTLVPAPGGAGVLVTSRSPLSAIEGSSSVSIGSLPADEARAFIRQVVSPERIAAELGASETLITICAGMPLALRLAGAILATRPTLTLAKLASDMQIKGALNVLVAGDLSVRNAIDVSYRTLSARARLSASRVAVGHGLLSEDRSALACDDEAEVLTELMNAGLLITSPSPGEGENHTLHPLVLSYVAELSAKQTQMPSGP